MRAEVGCLFYLASDVSKEVLKSKGSFAEVFEQYSFYRWGMIVGKNNSVEIRMSLLILENAFELESAI